jgi:hypothetical protein
VSPCEDGSGKPATGMKLKPRWPHTAFSCTTEGWAWARTRGGSVSYMCRIPAAGEQSDVATISCETYGRTTCTPLVCIHTVTDTVRGGWGCESATRPREGSPRSATAAPGTATIRAIADPDPAAPVRMRHGMPCGWRVGVACGLRTVSRVGVSGRAREPVYNPN